MAENICFFIRTFLIASSILILFGKATVDVNQCGSLKIEQPTILGKNVTFTFTPETTSDADLKWQRTNKRNPWSTLPTDNKFTQYFQDGTYYLILTNTVRRDDEVVYRVDYKNKSVNCLMETKKLQLQVIASNQCGFVYLRTTNLKEGENVEIEYYPSEYVMKYPERYVRQWKYSTQNSTFSVRLTKDVYEEEKEPNNKYMLTITMFNEQKNGRYGVYCGKTGSFTNMVEVILPVAPSAPAFEGLKEDIDDCKGCIVGEDGEQFSVLCKTSGGTQPITVNMSIGNEEQSPKRYDKIAGYMAFFILRTRHHMAIMTCTVMNDALTSPLIITARVYVIKSPTLKLLVPQILKEGSIGNITCIVDGGRPAPKAILNISGMEVPSAVQVDSFNATTSLYTSIVSLSTFERTWNSENVTCCRFNEWYKITSACSSPKRFNIMFPPSTINLEVKVEQKLSLEIYAVCTIYNSNPACGVDISAPNGVIVSERYTNNVSQPHGAWDSEHALKLNIDKDDNGAKIECSADCQNFAVNLNDARSIVLPYAPTIEFNISGSELAILQGEQVHVKCSAQSIPASNISWVEQSDVGNITLKVCQLQADCVIAVEANLTQQRKFICQTHYLQTSGQKTLTVNILVAPSEPAFEGLKDIDYCKDCIVAKDGDQFSVLCKTSGGTQPVTVTMSIGNESLSPQRFNETASYITYFTLRNRHHMAIMKCTVMNDALTSPLITTARVYVIKSPTLQLFVPKILKEGNNGNITCTMDGGRPAPNVTLNISGKEVSSAVQTDSFNATTSLYTSVVSLSTFERIWNSENVQCCCFNEWYKITNACSLQRRINIMFPPTDIKLEVKAEQKLPLEIYAICTVYNSNPACRVDISAPNGVIVSERYTNNMSRAHGAWDSEYAVNLNVDKNDDGENIKCAADCQKFAVDLKDVHSVGLPQKDEKHYKDMNNSASCHNSSIWIILGSCSAVLFVVVVIVCLIAIKKFRDTKAELEVYKVRFSANPDRIRNDVELEDRVYVELNDTRHTTRQSETFYSQLSP